MVKTRKKLLTKERELRQPPGLIYKQINPGIKSKKPARELTWRDYSPIDLDLDLFNNPCQKSINLNFRILQWRIKPIHLFRRNDDCRLFEKEISSYNVSCQPSPECNEERSVYIWWLNAEIEYNDRLVFDREHTLFWELFSYESTIDKVTFPVDKYENVTDTYQGDKVYVEIEYTLYYHYKANYDYLKRDYTVEPIDKLRVYKGKEVFYYHNFKRFWMGARETGHYGSAGRLYNHYSQYTNEKWRFKDSYRRVTKTSSDYLARGGVSFNSHRNGISGSNATPYRFGESYPVHSYYDYFGTKVVKFKTNIKYNLHIKEYIRTGLTFCENGDVFVSECYPNKKPPPPPKPKMRCCPDNSDLLRKILKIVKENKKAIGFNEYPVKVPKSLIKEDNKEKGTQDLENLTQFIGWFVERFDEIVGEFEIPIVVEDIDPETEGKQEGKAQIPNISEAIAEIFMMLLNISISTELHTNFLTRVLSESGSLKSQAFKSYMMIDSIIDYLGYKIEEKEHILPLTFTPGETDIYKMLKEKEQTIVCTEFADDNTLHHQLFELLQSAAIIRGANWQMFNKDKDIKEQLINRVKQAKTVLDYVSKDIDLDELEQDLNKIKKQQDK